MAHAARCACTEPKLCRRRAAAHLPDVALNRLGDVVYVLRLNDRLHIVLKNAREEVLQLAAAEVCEDLLPVRRVLRAGNAQRRGPVSESASLRCAPLTWRDKTHAEHE